MTFPIPNDEEVIEQSVPMPTERQEGNGRLLQFPQAAPVSTCPSCDGTGLWRGIDGYVFVCQHCTFEMT